LTLRSGSRPRAAAALVSVSLGLCACASLALVSARAVAAPIQPAAVSYTADRIHWTDTVHPTAISETGLVVGSLAYDQLEGQEHPPYKPFTYRPGHLTILPTLGGPGTYGHAMGVNRHGDVVGYAQREVNGQDHAFLWLEAEAQLVDLGRILEAGSSRAFDISDSRIVVGEKDGVAFAISAENGVRELGPGEARAINGQGHIVGSAYTDDFQQRPALWTPASNTPTLLPTFGGAYNNVATDVNDAGVIVGSSSRPGSDEAQGESRAFIFRNGTLQDLGNLPVENANYKGTAAFGINNQNQVVGLSNFKPFLWENNQMVSLSGALGRHNSQFLIGVSDINNAGKLAAQAWDGNRYYAYLLTPGGGGGGTSLPDLSATASINVLQSRRGPKTYRITGSLRVKNEGPGKARPSTVRLFVSSDNLLSSDDIKLGDVTVPELAHGATKNLKISLRALRQAQYMLVQGKYVIAQLDYGNKLTEVSEENNVVVSGQLPLLITPPPAQ